MAGPLGFVSMSVGLMALLIAPSMGDSSLSCKALCPCVGAWGF